MAEAPPNAKDLFLAALEIPEAVERAAFLDKSCNGDDALRQRVEDLLRAYGESGGPLDKLAAALAPTDLTEPIREQPGTIIAGRYKLVETLGQGGMGAVFMAQQTQPVKRLVALKLIKLGMDSKQVLVRFEAERQALALMDHPNIAKVLDAGATDSGRPFFVMELVKGVPITRFCDERQLSPRQRLELFIPVCQAIQHAHQKGIIHRDIKPTNVLVALYDDRPVPKVIDFGVAKAAGLQLTDASLVTGFGAIVGTPEYMSPEQAQLNQLDIDTRSDVYALGVVLYELLTGTTPIDRKRLAQGALFEILRVIREEEPLRPSTRLSTSDALPSIAATRGTEPTKLAKLMRGELDWIVMKCLEKDRSRRYETANGLAHDLERYLADEPVEACPPSSTYRLRKFAGKYKKALATAAAFMVLLVAGAVISTVLAVWATSAKQEALHAERNALDSEQKALDAKADADRQRDEVNLSAYASGIGLAQRALEENNVVRARELLEEVPKEAAGRKLRGFEWYYLSRLCHSEALTLHVDGVKCVTFSPDGQRLATGDWHNTVKIWDSATGKELLSLKGHTNGVWSVAFSPDGQRLACSDDRTVEIWDVPTRKELFSLKGHAGFVSSVAFSPDGQRLASGSGDNTVKIWDVATGKELFSLEGNADSAETVASRPSIESVAFSPDGQRLASGGDDRMVKIWDLATGKELVALKGHANWVQSVAFSPDGQHLASASWDDTVKIWDSWTGKEPFSLKGIGAITSVAFSPDGQRLASGGGDGTVKIWETATGKELFSLKGHAARVQSVAFSPDGERLASGSWDQTVKIWDSATGKELFSFKAHASGFESAGVESLAFSPNGQRLASGGGDGTVKIWKTATSKELFSLKGHAGEVWSVAFSPDGQRLASGSRDKTVRIWDTATGKELSSLKGHARGDNSVGVNSVTFSPDGRRLACSDDQTVKIWDSTSGKELLSLKGHFGWVWSVAFSPDGQRLASGSEDKTVKIWDSSTGRELLSLKGYAGGVGSVAFSPDGQRLASADGPIHLWETTSVSPEIRHRRATRQMVANLFERLLLRADVLERLRPVPGVSPAQRLEAITVAETYPEDALALNERARELSKLPGGEMSGYRKAMRYSDEARQLEPKNGIFLNTLGVAYYRVGNYEKAFATLLRSDQINKPQFRGSIPGDLAFLAMTQQQLGHAKEAQAELQRLRERMKAQRWAKDDEAQGFLREAEALLAKPKTLGGK